MEPTDAHVGYSAVESFSLFVVVTIPFYQNSLAAIELGTSQIKVFLVKLPFRLFEYHFDGCEQ